MMVYNIKRCPKILKKKKKKEGKRIEKKKVEEIRDQKEKLQILDYTILVRPRTIFISYSYNYSSKPSTVVTSSLNSG